MPFSDSLGGLATIAVRCATRGALEYLRKQQVDLDDFGPLNERIAHHVKTALPGALADAREAIACHMNGIAEQTFAASMCLAGIAAAKEWGDA